MKTRIRLLGTVSLSVSALPSLSAEMAAGTSGAGGRWTAPFMPVSGWADA